MRTSIPDHSFFAALADARKALFILMIVALSGWRSCYAQSFSKSSLKYAAGIGFSTGQSTDGAGPNFSVGYQREIWKDRLRLNPNVSFGYYSGKGINDVPDAYFNSFNFQTNLYLDVLRARSVSLVLGIGAFVNKSSGLVGTGGDPGRRSSKYVSDTHAGGYLGIGARYNPANKRIAIEIMPVNVYTDTQKFTEVVFFRVGIDVKLRKE